MYEDFCCFYQGHHCYVLDNLATSQNLWISGLSSTTRATDLKSVFSKFGKVSFEHQYERFF